MTWCGMTAAGPMCAPLCDGMPLERRGQPAAMFCPGPCISYLIAEDRVRGVGPYGSWAQLRAPSRHHCGRRGRHLWVVRGHGELAVQLAYAM